MKCTNCGTKIKQKTQRFCPECGTDITEQIHTKKKKRKKVLFLTGIPVILIAGLAITFFIVGKMKSDPQNIIDQFSESVENEDEESLSKLLTTNEDDLSIDDENSGILLDFLSENNSDYDTLIEDLENQAASLKEDEDGSESAYATVQLKKDGKTWVFFDDYKLDVTPAYIDIQSENEDTDVYINEKKLTTTPEDDVFEEQFGPLMPGTYTVKGEFETPYLSTEETEDVDLFNMEDKTKEQEISLNTGKITIISSFADEATLHINGEETDIEVGHGKQTIGPFPLDEPIDLKLVNEMPWGTIESDTITYQEDDTQVSFENASTIDDDEEEKIFEMVNDVFETYTEALSEKDETLLEEHVTENFQDELQDEVKDVDEDNPDYEGELVKTQYRSDWYSDPEHDEDEEVYKFELSVALTRHETDGDDLGDVSDLDKEDHSLYKRHVTILFDEEDDEWKVDSVDTGHFSIKDEYPEFELD